MEWQGELSRSSFLPATLSLLTLRVMRLGNTEGLGKDSSETRRPRLGVHQSQIHNTGIKHPQSL